MRKVIITGGKRLEGEVRVSGSKNAALPILTSTLLLRGESIIHNVPKLLDVTTIIKVLRSLGIKAEYSAPGTVRILTPDAIRHVAPYELVTKMRASFFVMGPILARMGLAKVPLPGGCAIGSRPVNLHIKGIQTLGAQVEMEHGFVMVRAEKLRGGRIYLDFPSVGATENILMAASLAQGTTIIENAAQEPEITDLANFLNSAGAKIEGQGTDVIKIEGVEVLRGIEYKIIPDRIEAGTLMVAAAITRGNVSIQEAIPSHLEAVASKLQECGVKIKMGKDKVEVKAPQRIKAVDIKTLPFPGFSTDMQPQFTALLSIAEGTSLITETVFENRFLHVHELKRMGANIRLEDRSVIIRGVNELSGAPVRVSDLRGGAALLLAGLSAEGETRVEDMERHIERGYEDIIGKLTSLGAQIKEI